MNQTDFNQLIRYQHQRLTDEYPFLVHWETGFDNAKRRAGACILTSKKILISKVHIELNTEEVVLDTILHEFSHAIACETYGDLGHGFNWKKIAKKIGATPKATGKFVMPESPWTLVLGCSKSKTIEKVATRHRRNRKIRRYFLKDKPSTQGKLFYIASDDYTRFAKGELKFEQLDLIQ